MATAFAGAGAGPPADVPPAPAHLRRGELLNPTGVTVARNGKLLVADLANRSLVQFSGQNYERAEPLAPPAAAPPSAAPAPRRTRRGSGTRDDAAPRGGGGGGGGGASSSNPDDDHREEDYIVGRVSRGSSSGGAPGQLAAPRFMVMASDGSVFLSDGDAVKSLLIDAPEESIVILAGQPASPKAAAGGGGGGGNAGAPPGGGGPAPGGGGAASGGGGGYPGTGAPPGGGGGGMPRSHSGGSRWSVSNGVLLPLASLVTSSTARSSGGGGGGPAGSSGGGSGGGGGPAGSPVARGADEAAGGVRLSEPWGLALDEDKQLLYIADSKNHAIRTCSIETGELVTLVEPGQGGLCYPVGLALDLEAGVLFVSDHGGIKAVQLADGRVSTYAGFGQSGLTDGQRQLARFNDPRGLALDSAGDLYVADRGNGAIRVVRRAAGVVETLLPAGMVTQPVDLDISEKGHLLVTDAYQGCLHVFDLGLARRGAAAQLPSSYTGRMAALLASGDSADVRFLVGGEEIPAHRLILSTHCDYFAKMLAGQEYSEGKTGVVMVEDSTPAALRQLLRYIYTDELRFSEDCVLDVMLLAQKMIIPRVLAHCMMHVRHNLRPSNSVAWLIWADEHAGFSELRAMIFQFVVKHLREVRRHKEALAELQRRRPDLLIEIIMAV